MTFEQPFRWNSDRRGIAALALALVACQPSVTTPILVPASSDGTNPLAGVSLFVDPASRAATQANAWRASRPADAQLMDMLASQPIASWMTNATPDVRAAVAAVGVRARQQGTLPVYVAYNIPNRNCGAGGPSASGYRAWMREFAAGLSGRSIVVLEPDAVPGADCLPAGGRDERYALLRDAVQLLKAANATVYIDAGNARWLSTAKTAQRLLLAGVGSADGFALNVAHYLSTSENLTYGAAISGDLGGKRFVIDAGRNGAGGSGIEWCNVPGQALGENPTTSPSYAFVDAILWVKQPGESDGTCNGGPVPGSWWPEYALDLARRRAP